LTGLVRAGTLDKGKNGLCRDDPNRAAARHRDEAGHPTCRTDGIRSMNSNVDKLSLENASSIGGDAPAHDVPQARPAGHRLGPLFGVMPLRRPVVGRLYAGGIAIAAGLILGLALALNPAPRGYGTHNQMSLYPYPCGFLTVTGFPCPTCGMTTAFAHTVRGQFIHAFMAQPAGLLLAVCTALAGVTATFVLLTGRRPMVNWFRVNPNVLAWSVVAILVTAWAFKIAVGLAEHTLPAR
jgi:hypothetical protein